MNILITGATGFVGQKLAKRLIQKGYRIYVLTRSAKKYEGYLPFPCILLEPKELDAKLRQGLRFKSIVNLAGENVAQKWNPQIKKSIYESRVLGTRGLVEIFNNNKAEVESFVSASAIGYYGNRGEESLKEDSAPANTFLAKVCTDWEKEAQRAEGFSKNVVILRIGIVLGENEGALKQMLPPFKNGVGGQLADGKAWMSWVHIDDLVEMFVECVENSKWSGIYNAVSEKPVTNLEFSKAVADALGTKLFLPVPRLALKAIYGEMSEIILSSQKVLPSRFLEGGFQFKYKNLADALKSLIEKCDSNESKVTFEQWVPKKITEIFHFFENEKNLEALTPGWLNFKVLKKSTPKLQKGTLIDYSLQLYGIPFYWTTLIEDWKENEYFVDTQKKGPYQKWHHTHEFENLGDGTIVRDIVRYKVPAGALGKFATGWKVDSDVQAIFKYRADKVKEIFFKNDV